MLYQLVRLVPTRRCVDTGATMVEYALLLVLIAIAVVAAGLALGAGLNNLFLRARDCIATGVIPC